jgi:hypothetical protein
MDHTPEPWHINDWPQYDANVCVAAGAEPSKMVARFPLRDVSVIEQVANARRAIACVNACAGIPDEMLAFGVAPRAVVSRRET